MERIIEQMPIVLGALNSGFLQTLRLFFITLIGAVPLGLVIAFGSMSKFRPLSMLSKFIVWIIRGTPLMIQLLIIFYFPGLVLHKQIWGGGETGRFLAASLSFVLNYACYFSEIYRGGIQSVPAGQEEAGLVLGMTKTQIFFKVKLMQMIKRIVPKEELMRQSSWPALTGLRTGLTLQNMGGDLLTVISMNFRMRRRQRSSPCQKAWMRPWRPWRQTMVI